MDFKFIKGKLIRIKYTISILLLIVFCHFIFSCNPKKRIKEGQIIYQIEYPNNKDNFFLYHVLPKEMTTSFRNNKMEIKIVKAGMENTIIIDNLRQNMYAFYNYDDKFVCKLNSKEINKLKNSQPKYKIKFLNESDTMMGINIKKASAIDPNRPYDPIEIWYTNDIALKNTNWFNGFDKIPGVLLKYHIIQNGIKMVFTVKKIENIKINDSILELKRDGKRISYSRFNSLIDGLFENFKE